MRILSKIYKGKLINLSRQLARLPNGYEAILEVIKHPGAALIIPFLSSKEIIFLKQFRPVINSYLYELPAGTLNAKESSICCARREIIEETGYCAKSFKRLGEIYPVPGYSTEKIVIYKAEGLKKCKVKPEKDEVISSFPMPKNRVRILFRRGEIKDAKTISALATVGWL